ncbi:hypothetical protein EJD97_016363 [Solanum chilense]|uniref:Uncharacterized protein n=1 Tax=Solanum chilense TaxID=4083 RepID=A0A6N2BA21_SOLCI|nr:hypothetical protein EJD97_016363 [Solanum chilense]
MGVFDFTVIPILGDPHPPSSPSSKSCHNMMEKGLKSSLILVKETNKKKERISKSKATSSAAASMKFCVCAPPTHPDSFKCRLHRATASAHPRTVSSSTSKKICLCAPATHPGSFKCRLHRATTSSHTGNFIVCSSHKWRQRHQKLECLKTGHVFTKWRSKKF